MGSRRRSDDSSQSLSHVVVAAGTPSEWLTFGVSEWTSRIDDVVHGAAVGGARFITLRPYGGDELSDMERDTLFATIEEAVPIELVGSGELTRGVWQANTNTTFIIDPNADGRRRFAAVVEEMRMRGVNADDIDDVLLDRELLAPATVEPDLVVVLGQPIELPTSLVWELAYSELVFLDFKWDDLSRSHLEIAVDDFHRRHRRFGGLDS